MRTYRSPFERLRAKFDESDPECPSCGCAHEDANWRVTTTGGRVTYQYVCPTCEAVETRELRLA